MVTETKLSSAEILKGNSRHLRGTIAEELDNTFPYFSNPATGVLKFHGIYQQDDRDLRKLQPERASAPWSAWEFRVGDSAQSSTWNSTGWRMK